MAKSDNTKQSTLSSSSSTGHLRHLINHIIKIIFLDSTVIQGELKGFDVHMNLLLANCTEVESTGTTPSSNGSSQKKRQMGFILVRGEQILATSVVSSPLISIEEKKLIQKKKLEQIELKLKKEKLDKLTKFEKKKQKSLGGLKKSVESSVKKNSNKKTVSNGKKEQGKKSKINVNFKKNNKKSNKNNNSNNKVK